MSSSESSSARHHSLDFASLTPADKRTARGAQVVADNIQTQGLGSEYPHDHHKKFVRSDAGSLVATRSPTFSPVSPDPGELTEALTTEADLSDDEKALLLSISLCYVFSLDQSRLPFDEKNGYWFGTGDVARFWTTAESISCFHLEISRTLCLQHRDRPILCTLDMGTSLSILHTVSSGFMLDIMVSEWTIAPWLLGRECF